MAQHHPSHHGQSAAGRGEEGPVESAVAHDHGAHTGGSARTHLPLVVLRPDISALLCRVICSLLTTTCSFQIKQWYHAPAEHDSSKKPASSSSSTVEFKVVSPQHGYLGQ